jgi:hypothetical protein
MNINGTSSLARSSPGESSVCDEVRAASTAEPARAHHEVIKRLLEQIQHYVEPWTSHSRKDIRQDVLTELDHGTLLSVSIRIINHLKIQGDDLGRQLGHQLPKQRQHIIVPFPRFLGYPQAVRPCLLLAPLRPQERAEHGHVARVVGFLHIVVAFIVAAGGAMNRARSPFCCAFFIRMNSRLMCSKIASAPSIRLMTITTPSSRTS